MKFDPTTDVPKGYELVGMMPVDEQTLEELQSLQAAVKDAQKRYADIAIRAEELSFAANESAIEFNGRLVGLKRKLFGYAPMQIIFDEEKGALFALKESGGTKGSA